MIALDTNVVLRFLLRDDEAQYAAATARINSLTETEKAFVSREVMIEIAWVLRRSYKYSRQSVCRTLSQIASADVFELEDRRDVQGAILAYEKRHGDFADAMIAAAAKRAGASQLVTFDKRAAELPGARLLET